MPPLRDLPRPGTRARPRCYSPVSSPTPACTPPVQAAYVLCVNVLYSMVKVQSVAMLVCAVLITYFNFAAVGGHFALGS